MIPLLYRVLLRLYPRDFRERFGEDFIATARAVDRAPSRRRWRALRDALESAMLARGEQGRRRTSVNPARKDFRMSRLLTDLRFALRGIRKEPRFAAFVIATLAVAIGANATLLGLADRLIFTGPERIDDPGRVMRVQLVGHPPNRPTITTFTMGHVLFAAIRDRGSNGIRAASYAINEATLGRAAAARPLQLGYASPEFFELLGTKPARGRFLDARDAGSVEGGPVVISHRLWQREFAGDSQALGRTVVIDDVARTVVGIAPQGFTGVELGPVDAWLLVDLLNARTTPQWQTAWNAQWLHTIVRLPRRIDRPQVESEFTNILGTSYTGQSQMMRTAELRLTPLAVSRDSNEAADARILGWLFGVAALVFLVACANVMSLLLARGAARRREVGVRIALGASRAAVVRQFLIEAGVLATLGLAGGLALAALLGEAARLLLFDSVEWTSSPVNGRVIAGSAVIAVAATILTGLWPALSASRVSVLPALRGTARGGGLRRSRVRSALTIVQAAVSVILLVGAGLFIRSLWNASTLDLGVDADQVLVAEVSRPRLGELPEGVDRDTERARRKRMLREALPSIRSLPGVDAASVAIGMPFGFAFALDVSLPGAGPIAPSGSSVSAVTDGYFETVGTDILDGRPFNSGDREGSAPVVIVSAHLARQLWPGRSPLGSCLIVGKEPAPCATVVGVAANTHRERLREAPIPHIYLPAGQEKGFGGDVLLVRADRGFDVVADAVRQRLAGLDSTINVVHTETLRVRIDPQLRSWRLGASVFIFAGGLALLVASAGIYSVLSYLVAARRHEIGVRLALGATTAHVGGVVIRSSLSMALTGIGLGLAAAAIAAPRLQPLLFDVPARDPLVFLTVAGLLTIVAIATSVTPAIRASRVNPLEVLRSDS
jgi:predicted permease